MIGEVSVQIARAGVPKGSVSIRFTYDLDDRVWFAEAAGSSFEFPFEVTYGTRGSGATMSEAVSALLGKLAASGGVKK